MLFRSSQIGEEPEWERLYSVRQADELRQALLDCDCWLECVGRAEKEARKESTP